MRIEIKVYTSTRTAHRINRFKRWLRRTDAVNVALNVLMCIPFCGILILGCIVDSMDELLFLKWMLVFIVWMAVVAAIRSVLEEMEER